MKLFKYEFVSKLAFTRQLNQLKDEEGEVQGVKALIELGFIQLQNGSYDEEGNEIAAPLLSDKYCVDIIWKDDVEPDNFKSYYVEPQNPKHKILGWKN